MADCTMNAVVGCTVMPPRAQMKHPPRASDLFTESLPFGAIQHAALPSDKATGVFLVPCHVGGPSASTEMIMQMLYTHVFS
jgi:hypothetical protein